MNNLTEEEQKKVEELRTAITPHAAASVELRAFVTDSCLLRYLRARNWRVKDATKMLINTLQWRAEYKPHALRWPDVEGEALTGKQFILPAMDVKGHPVLVLRPRNETTRTHERQLQFLVYHLEAASLMADQAGVGKMMWLVDFVGYNFSTAPPARISIQTVHILQNHYPERLGVCICYLPPRIFSYTWKAVSPFIDSNTRNRIHFVNNAKDAQRMLPPLLDMSNIERCMTGTSDYQYNFEEYSVKMRELDAAADAKIAAATKAANNNGSLRNISVNGSAMVY